MYSRSTIIQNPTGLHARPATEFVAASKKYASRITLCATEHPEETVNAKSIVLLLSLGLSKGTSVTLTANGGDEAAAVDALIALIDSGFGE